jgi:hypothetical protein
LTLSGDVPTLFKALSPDEANAYGEWHWAICSTKPAGGAMSGVFPLSARLAAGPATG